MKTKLHYSDILSVTDGRLVSINGLDGVYKACNALAGPGVTTLALGYLQKPLSEHLRKVLPEFDNPLMGKAISHALERWKNDHPNTKDAKTLEKYLDTYVSQGMLNNVKEYEVEHLGEDGVQELMENYTPYLDKVFAGKQVVVVKVPEEAVH